MTQQDDDGYPKETVLLVDDIYDEGVNFNPFKTEHTATDLSADDRRR